MKKDVKVTEVDGRKELTVGGIELLGYTKQVREKVQALDIDPENHEDGEVVGEIEVEIDE